MRGDGKVLYTTNLAGGGPNGLVTITLKASTVTVAGETDTPFAVPHNIAVSDCGGFVYVTHSGGTSDKVTKYSTTADNPVPVLVSALDVGLNPFGLDFVPAQ